MKGRRFRDKCEGERIGVVGFADGLTPFFGEPAERRQGVAAASACAVFPWSCLRGALCAAPSISVAVPRLLIWPAQIPSCTIPCGVWISAMTQMEGKLPDASGDHQGNRGEVAQGSRAGPDRTPPHCKAAARRATATALRLFFSCVSHCV